MGSTSSSLDWADTTNDFELVVRIAKELDQTLNEKFGADKDLSLMEKITDVRDKINIECEDDMRTLVKWRNRLVHEYGCNSLADLGTSRHVFHNRYAKVKKDLMTVITQRNSQTVAYRTAARQTTTDSTTLSWLETGLFAAAVVGGIAAVSSAVNEEEERKKKNSSWRRS